MNMKNILTISLFLNLINKYTSEKTINEKSRIKCFDNENKIIQNFMYLIKREKN